MHVFQVSGYTSSQPSTTASASLMTSTTGNFDFLSPLTFAGRDNTGGGVGQETDTGHETLSEQVLYSVSDNILKNNWGNVSQMLVGLNGATGGARQEQMNSSSSVSLVTRISGTIDNFTGPSLYGQLFKTACGGRVQSVISKNPGQTFNIDINGIKNRNPPQIVGLISLNVGSTGVPMSVVTSAVSSLAGNVASEQSLNVIPANFPILITHQPVVPNVMYQSQVFSP